MTEDVRDPAWTLPNLVPDVSTVGIEQFFVFDPETQTFVLGPPMLAFDTISQNLGSVPIDLLVDEVPPQEVTPVAQCVSWAADRVCRERRGIGGIVWHDSHSHYHLEDFATYELRRLAADGRPDYSGAGLVAVSEKVSFCLIDSYAVREDAFPVGTYFTCDAPAVMGISAGWADVYDSSLPGQQFSRDGLTDGRYALVIRVDDANHLYESDDSDNTIEVVIELSEGVTQASIVEKRIP